MICALEQMGYAIGTKKKATRHHIYPLFLETATPLSSRKQPTPLELVNKMCTHLFKLSSH